MTAVYIEGNTRVFGIDDDGDILVSKPGCTHVLGYPVATVRSLVAAAGEAAMLVLTCPDCPGATYVHAATLLSACDE